MNALIIDEHKSNRLYTRRILVENFSVFKLIDEAESVAQALSKLEVCNYDVIILDMELPDGIGFDVLKVIKDFVYVIVVSSHKEYAIAAFKHNVVDYILKPLNIVEFKNAIKKVVLKHQESGRVRSVLPITEKNQSGPDAVSALMIHYNNAYITIHIKDILFIKAFGKNSQIHMCDNKQYTSYKNLKEFQSAMSADLIRTHHSYLVNLNNIVSYSRDTSHVLLNGGAVVPVSVRKREELFKKFRVF